MYVVFTFVGFINNCAQPNKAPIFFPYKLLKGVHIYRGKPLIKKYIGKQKSNEY